jgi:hypothetical protein
LSNAIFVVDVETARWRQKRQLCEMSLVSVPVVAVVVRCVAEVVARRQFVDVLLKGILEHNKKKFLPPAASYNSIRHN